MTNNPTPTDPAPLEPGLDALRQRIKHLSVTDPTGNATVTYTVELPDAQVDAILAAVAEAVRAARLDEVVKARQVAHDHNQSAAEIRAVLTTRITQLQAAEPGEKKE